MKIFVAGATGVMGRRAVAALAFAVTVGACSKGALFTSAEPPPSTYLKPGTAPSVRAPERPKIP